MEVDVRLIVASNENLQEAYRKGKFRKIFITGSMSFRSTCLRCVTVKKISFR
ncbi:MAG: hypothetical protein WDO16_03705 [Bacteroidota bacterium]